MIATIIIVALFLIAVAFYAFNSASAEVVQPTKVVCADTTPTPVAPLVSPVSIPVTTAKKVPAKKKVVKRVRTTK